MERSCAATSGVWTQQFSMLRVLQALPHQRAAEVDQDREEVQQDFVNQEQYVQ
jgi:hypothetical protein